MKIFLSILLILIMRGPIASQTHSAFIRKAYLDKNGREIVMATCAMGDSLLKAGNYAGAEANYQSACNLTDSLLKSHQISSVKSAMIKNWGIILDCYDKAAQLYAIAGNPWRAKKYYELSIHTRELVFPRLSVHRIAPYIGLGKMYYESGNYDEAFEAFATAARLLSHATTSNFNFDYLNEQLYYYWFEVNLKKGNIKEASKYLEQFFLAVNTTNYSSEQLAICFEAKARFYLAQNDLSNCDYFLKKAERHLSGTAVFSKSRVKILRTRALMGWRSGNIPQASRTFINLIDTYRQAIEENFPSMNEHEREQFYSLLKSDFDLFNSFVLAHPQEEFYERLYNNQLFTKALLLNEINKTKTAIMNSNDAALKSKFLKWQQGKEALASLYFKGPEAQAQVRALEQQLDDLEKEINLKSGLLNTGVKEPDWQQVANALKTEEAAIEIVRIRSWHRVNIPDKPSVYLYDFSDSTYYLALLLAPKFQRPEGFVIEDGTGLENKFLHFYRNSILEKQPDTLTYNKFWKPLAEHTRKFKRIFISADGVYNQINLNALQNPTTKQYVIDEKDLVFVTNTKDLLIPTSEVTQKTADLYGKPAYSFAPDLAATHPQNKFYSGSRSFGLRELMDLKGESFTELPGTEEEVNTIDRQLVHNGWTVTEYLGKEASETRLKTNPAPTVLHIATHGFFQNGDNHANNAMIRSGIILSGVNNPNNGNGDDGILTAFEATDLNLDKTELVVLSACETGLGENKNGEGVYGLQRGFKVAGAKNLIMSLWRVDDFATSSLMSAFYGAWTTGTDIHQAFRQAQLEVRKKYPEPFYWSAFILLGN